jgi:hypothetical protein
VRCSSRYVASAAVVLTLSGCGGGDEPGSVAPSTPASATAPAPAAPPSPTPTPTPTSTPVDEAAVLAAYQAYWAASVAVQAGNVDPQLFAGNTGDALIELQMKSARDYQEWGVAREGEPGLSDVDVEVDGTQARVFACVDYTTWVIPGADEGEAPGVVPATVRLEQVDGAWLVMEFVESDPARTC